MVHWYAAHYLAPSQRCECVALKPVEFAANNSRSAYLALLAGTTGPWRRRTQRLSRHPAQQQLQPSSLMMTTTISGATRGMLVCKPLPGGKCCQRSARGLHVQRQAWLSCLTGQRWMSLCSAHGEQLQQNLKPRMTLQMRSSPVDSRRTLP